MLVMHRMDNHSDAATPWANFSDIEQLQRRQASQNDRKPPFNDFSLSLNTRSNLQIVNYLER